jgi:general L-amino acid transport system substrate-binding protein
MVRTAARTSQSPVTAREFAEMRSLSGRLAVLAVCATLCLLAIVPRAQAAATLDAIRARGHVVCGIAANLPAMSIPDGQGRWTGFHVEICRAYAVALFADPEKVRFVPVTAQQRFTALQSGEIDVLEGPNALTLTRDTALGITAPATVFYTGQGFLVSKRLNVKGAAELNGATICAVQGSEIERNVADYTARLGIRMTTVAFDTNATLLGAFFAGRCDAVSNDMVSLAASMVGQPNRADYALLPDIIAKEPHGPMVRADDPQWFALVRWTVFALIQAEEFGLTRANASRLPPAARTRKSGVSSASSRTPARASASPTGSPSTSCAWSATTASCSLRGPPRSWAWSAAPTASGQRAGC